MTGHHRRFVPRGDGTHQQGLVAGNADWQQEPLLHSVARPEDLESRLIHSSRSAGPPRRTTGRTATT